MGGVAGIPGPAGDRFEEVEHDFLGFLERSSRAYGPLVAFELAGRLWVLVNDPELIHDVLTAPFSEVGGGPSLVPGARTMGHSITMNYEPSWRPRRALIQRPLSHRNVLHFGDLMLRRARELADSWSSAAEVELHADLSRLTLTIVAEALFSWDVDAVLRKILAASQEFHGDFVRSWLGPPREPSDAFRAAHASYEALVRDIIARRRVETDSGDLLGMLLEARDADGQLLDDEAVRDEANTLIFAGHSTTSLALTYAFSLLSRHATVQRELADAIAEQLGSRPLVAGDLEQIPLIRAVVEETLRLYPVNHFQDRTALVDVRLGDTTIAAGMHLLMSAWLVQRDERYFPDALAFRPERFLPEQRRSIPKYAYFPFGLGPKVCAGNFFALLEAALVVGTMVQRYELRPAEPEPPRLRPTNLLDPAADVRIRLRGRRVPEGGGPSPT